MDRFKPNQSLTELKEFIRHEIRKISSRAYKPSSVYRLQLNREFNFQDAIQVVPYLKELGVDAVYCSPYFESLSSSSHGYDVVNPERIDPKLGAESDYIKFCETLKKEGMGHIADIVPNHMGIFGTQNLLWMDVLENGVDSIHATYFDIDWEPEKRDLHGKVLLPILGDHYGKIISNNEISLKYDADQKAFFIHYWEHAFPISPNSYPFILEQEVARLNAKDDQEGQAFLELRTIITSFRNLPQNLRMNRLKVEERNKEKEIAKNRLLSLFQKSSVIQRYILDCIESFNSDSEDARFQKIHSLLEQQPYRLSYWRVASEEINYRRFFDVNALAAIRVEDPETFENYHKFLFDLIDKGYVQGIRIDHTDGLYDPSGYLKKIQHTFLHNEVCKLLKKSGFNNDGKIMSQQIREVIDEPEFSSAKPLYVIVEKILEGKEVLPNDWMVHGTVGYDFLNALNGLFIKQSNEKSLTQIYEQFSKLKIDFNELLYEKKKYFALIHMASEINSLGHRLDLVSETNPHYRDFTLNNLTLAIREVISCFPVYRTYISPQDNVVSERDEKYIHIAIEKAKQKTPALNPEIYEFLQAVLLLRLEEELTSHEKMQYHDFTLKFQQITGPIMAKGFEDTVFYIYNRLLSLNEVGGNPVRFGTSVSEFHKVNVLRQRNWPHSFITTSTHDTKRSADVRERISVLSEIPRLWKSNISRWSILNKKFKKLSGKEWIPDKNTEYFIYQTLLGIWSEEQFNTNREGFVSRLHEIVLKSIREAKIYTNWTNPNQFYENSVKEFVAMLLLDSPENEFLKYFKEFHTQVAQYGMLNSISSLVLRLGSPGVLDVYQGSDLWDDRFVDPDNRTVVDFECRHRVLKQFEFKNQSNEKISLVKKLFEERQTGQIKLFLFQQGLQFRRKNQKVFTDANYIPLEIKGRKKDHCIAFARVLENQIAIVIAGRHFADLKPKDPNIYLGESAWKSTWVVLPKDKRILVDVKFKNIFTNQVTPVKRNKKNIHAISLEDAFSDLTACILVSEV